MKTEIPISSASFMVKSPRHCPDDSEDYRIEIDSSEIPNFIRMVIWENGFVMDVREQTPSFIRHSFQLFCGWTLPLSFFERFKKEKINDEGEAAK